MATPASLFRPAAAPASAPTPPSTPPVVAPATEPQVVVPQPAAAANGTELDAVEIELLVPPSGTVSLAGHQLVWLGKAFSGRTVTVWAGHRSVHVLLDGQHVKTLTSRLSAVHLQQLMMRGARPAGPASAALALPRSGPLPPASVIEADRTVDRHGYVQIGTHPLLLDARLAGARVTLRLDGHLIHVISDNHLVKSLPSPIPHDERVHVRGARIVTAPLPPRPVAGPQQVQRRVPRDGVIMVARQRLRVGRTHAGKTVTVLAEDTHFHVTHDGHELSLHPRDPSIPLRHFKAHAPRLSQHG